MDNNDFLKKIVIPDLEISECTEHEVKSKTENICQWKKYSNNIWFQFMKLILIFMSITEKKKYKLMKMGGNIYYLELMFVLFLSCSNRWKR